MCLSHTAGRPASRHLLQLPTVVDLIDTQSTFNWAIDKFNKLSVRKCPSYVLAI
jgi:hypothetical protein